MKLYTRKGDQGETGILGKDRLPKDDLRIEAYGTVDELNSIIGMTLHHAEEDLRPILQTIQSLLFEIGAELASVKERGNLSQNDIDFIEDQIDTASAETPAIKSFILPGGHEGASWFHLARTVSRRAERRVVSLDREVEINQLIIPILNRLSDLFFALARLQNYRNGIEDISWEART